MKHNEKCFKLTGKTYTKWKRVMEQSKLKKNKNKNKKNKIEI